jgi:hypothetical protein
MKSGLYKLLKKTPARYLYHRIKALRGGASQSNEALILVGLADACPKTFVEFGFHPTEYKRVVSRCLAISVGQIVWRSRIQIGCGG